MDFSKSSCMTSSINIQMSLSNSTQLLDTPAASITLLTLILKRRAEKLEKKTKEIKCDELKIMRVQGEGRKELRCLYKVKISFHPSWQQGSTPSAHKENSCAVAVTNSCPLRPVWSCVQKRVWLHQPVFLTVSGGYRFASGRTVQVEPHICFALKSSWQRLLV